MINGGEVDKLSRCFRCVVRRLSGDGPTSPGSSKAEVGTCETNFNGFLLLRTSSVAEVLRLVYHSIFVQRQQSCSIDRASSVT